MEGRSEITGAPGERAERKPLMRVLSGVAENPPPVWLMRQAGRHLPEYRELRGRARNFLDFCYTPELAVEATLQPIRRYRLDAAILFSDILVIADALGARAAFKQGEGPVVSPVRRERDVDRLSTDGIAEACAPVYETLDILADELPPEVALIGFAGGPWTVATYMVEGRSGRDHGVIKRMMWSEPELFDRLMDLLVTATAEHLISQIEYGADCVQIFESWASALAEPEFERYVVAPTRKITDAVHAAFPGVSVIGFPRGAGYLIDRYAEAAGVDALGLDTTVPLSAASALQKRLPVQGHLDPALLVAGGDAMVARTRAIVDALADGAHVFNLGHGVVPETPPENVELLLKTIRGA